MDSTLATPPTDLRAERKSRVGVVISDKMDKTRVIKVAWQTTHPRYHKVMRRMTRFYAHDEKNESHMGDRVEITETRPMSKLKRWRVVRIVEKSK